MDNLLAYNQVAFFNTISPQTQFHCMK